MTSTTWGWLIAIYLLLGGVSAGAAVIHGYNGISKMFGERIHRASGFLAPFPVMAGLLLLIFDLHRPSKFYKLMFNYNFTSVMSWGVLLLGVFTIVSLWSMYLVYRGKEAPRGIYILNVILGLGVGGYTGLLLSAISSNPLWGTHALPILFLVSALSTGIAGTLLVGHFLDSSHSDEEAKLEKTDRVLLVLEITVLLAVILGWAYAPKGDLALKALLTGTYGLLFWLGFILIGLVIPFVLLWRKSQGNTGKNFTILIASMVLFGGALLRIIVVFAGQSIYPGLGIY